MIRLIDSVTKEHRSIHADTMSINSLIHKEVVELLFGNDCFRRFRNLLNYRTQGARGIIKAQPRELYKYRWMFFRRLLKPTRKKDASAFTRNVPYDKTPSTNNS